MTRDTMLYVENSTNITIENNEFRKSTGRVIEIVNSSNILIRNNYLQGFNYSFNGLIIDGSDNVIVENNTFESHVQAIILANSDEISIISNNIHNNTIGIAGWGMGTTSIIHNNISLSGNVAIIGFSTASEVIITISENYIIDTYISAIDFFTDTDLIITNNQIVNTIYGIGILGQRNANISVIVENNEILQSGTSAIHLSNGVNYVSIKNNTITYDEDGINDISQGIFAMADGGVISDNYIENYPNGINIGATKNLKVSDNKLKNIKDNAVLIFKSENITVSQNTIINTDKAIFIKSSENILLLENHISDSNYGIYIEDSSRVNVINNTFINTNTVIRMGLSFSSITGDGNYRDGDPYKLPSEFYRILSGFSLVLIIAIVIFNRKYPKQYKKILTILNKKI